MRLKPVLKRLFLGAGSLRPRPIRFGLLRGLTFLLDTRDRSLRLLAMDERELVGALREWSAGATEAIDVGASDGWYALYFASCPSVSRVFAFEPEADLRARTIANFRLNAPALLGKLDLRPDFVGNAPAAGLVRLDDVLPLTGGSLIVKIDVEGAELDVLKGAARLLGAGKARLVVETHSAKLEADCLQYLTELGYRVRVVRNGWYRALLPERRVLPHNRWLIAWPGP